MPSHDECRDDALVTAPATCRGIDDRDLLLHRIEEPAVIRRVRVGAHECIIDDIITRVDLALIVIPDRAPCLGNTVRIDSSLSCLGV
jgi:hypothetical protein